jgi:hypothetical protein
MRAQILALAVSESKPPRSDAAGRQGALGGSATQRALLRAQIGCELLNRAHREETTTAHVRYGPLSIGTQLHATSKSLQNCCKPPRIDDRAAAAHDYEPSTPIRPQGGLPCWQRSPHRRAQARR